MPRVTGEQVKDIFDTTLTAEEMAPFIRAADVYIGTRLDSVYSSDEIMEIERWVAAEFATARDPRVKSEDLLGDTTNYAGSDSPYWDMVKKLDRYGVLTGDAPASAEIWVN
jgi:hypothetical protein